MDATQCSDWNKSKNEILLRHARKCPKDEHAPEVTRKLPMIVCSCNVLSDNEVRTAVNTAAPRSAAQVYGCLGCSPQCGRCITTIRRIMDAALGACPTAGGCCGNQGG